MMLLLSLLLWQQASSPTVPELLRYQRPLLVQGRGQACAVLDPVIFPHAAPSLRDLRLFAAGREIPYALTLSETTQEDDDPAEVTHLTTTPGATTFDLEMPDRPYTVVKLNLDGTDFTLQAKVSAEGRQLGTFTLFDMTAEHLARQTTLSLQESHFRRLHITLTGPRLPKVLGADVPPSRIDQMLYSPVAQSSAPNQRATFRLPARVPVERVHIAIDPAFKGDFSRLVRITARSDAPNSATETIDGEIAHIARGGRKLDTMSFPAALGANLQGDATVEVAIQPGHEPLPIQTISLEMRQRQLCFDAFGAAPTLLYGGSDLPPASTYAFTPAAHPLKARFGTERPNPQFRTLIDDRPFWQRNGEWIWMGIVLLLGVVGTLGIRYAQRNATR